MQPKLRLFAMTLSVIFLSFVSPLSFAQPSVSTDLTDYPPGATVLITGSGFQYGETVTLQVNHTGVDAFCINPLNHQPWTVQVQPDGSFQSTWLVPLDGDALWQAFILTANGSAGSYAESFFTDAGTAIISASPAISGINSVVQYTFTIKNTTPDDNNSSTSDNINSILLTIPAGFVVPALPVGATSYISSIEVLDALGNVVTDPTRAWQVYTGGSGGNAFIQGYNNPNEFAIQVNNSNGALAFNESVRFTLYIQNPAAGGNYTWDFKAYANSNINGASFNATNPITTIVACFAPSVNVGGQPANQSITYGDNATFTFSTTSASYQWQEGITVAGITTWTNIINGGVYSGATTNQLTLTNPPVSMSGYQYRCIASACLPVQTTTSNAALLTVAKKQLTVTADAKSKTYDGLSFTGGGGVFTSTFSGFAGSETLATSDVTGSEGYSGAATTAINAGSYTITPTLNTLVSNNYSFSFANGTLTINKAEVCVVYNGDLFKNTSSTTGGSASVKISLVVSKSPITAPGDLNSVQVSLTVDGVTYSTSSLTYPLTKTIITKDASNQPTSIEYSFTKTLALVNNTYSNTWDITWTIGGNYQAKENCSDDYAQVTISSLSNDFATGGGYITNANSRGVIGIVAGETPAKNNFGFDIKWNKSQTNFQGHFNSIIRSGGRSYQVKSSNPASILTYKTLTGFRSTITYSKANIQDLTSMQTGTCIPGPVWLKCSDGNATVILTIEDNGEPGSTGTPSNDKYAITVKDKNGVLFYASNVAGPATVNTLPTAFKYLSGGNIQIRSTTLAPDPNEAAINSSITSSRGAVATEVVPQELGMSLTAYPNPSFSQFTVKLQSGDHAQKIQLRITDVNGRVVQLMNNLSAGQLVQVGATYRPGIYIIEMIQGKQRKQIQLVKTPD